MSLAGTRENEDVLLADGILLLPDVRQCTRLWFHVRPEEKLCGTPRYPLVFPADARLLQRNSIANLWFRVMSLELNAAEHFILCHKAILRREITYQE